MTLVLLHRAKIDRRRQLQIDPAGSITEGREDLSKKPYAIVYHRCSECRRSAVEAESGRVEVRPEAVDRIEAQAEVVKLEEKAVPSEVVPLEERDEHNTPEFR